MTKSTLTFEIIFFPVKGKINDSKRSAIIFLNIHFIIFNFQNPLLHEQLVTGKMLSIVDIFNRFRKTCPLCNIIRL